MAGYKDQVHLLIQVIPEVEKEKEFALHGGTAINLFLREMPRLSVDIDLTYVSLDRREIAFMRINQGLKRIKSSIEKNIPGTKVNHQSEQLKLQVFNGKATIKVEVNQGIRGVIGSLNPMLLCERAQEEFDAFCSIQGVPLGQLYGGKICAALDRQHPRDLFDVHYMLEHEGITEEIKRGFLFSLLSSQRPLREILFPNKIDQRETFNNQFQGMTNEEFYYGDFENTRDILIQEIHESLTPIDIKFILDFKSGDPDWSYYDFGNFPAVQWKLGNIRKLKEKNPERHFEILANLKKKLALS